MNPPLAQRTVTPEWLDALPPTDARARSSRHDLQRLNWWMAHVSIMRRALARPPSSRIIELGSGDGTFMLRLARTLPAAQLTLVDRHPCISKKTLAEFGELGWSVEVAEADVFDWLPEHKPSDVILANLFLHHFEPTALAHLLGMTAARCQTFVACEPQRGPLALGAARLLWMIGCHPVTRHDAAISVRAGFSGDELSAVWPQAGWKIQERRAHLFSHLFVARKQ